MIDVIEKEECTGCKMCKDICPFGAISFETDIEGFWYPKVDYDKCTNCKLCINTCPTFSKKILTDERNLQNPIIFVAQSNNTNLRINSTSGGIYGEIAKMFLVESNYIAGVVYDDDFLAKHVLTNKVKDFDKLIRTKYFQSNTNEIFLKVKNVLKTNKKVLFSGNPCQVSALYNYLGKEYDNLYTTSFICRGNLSPKAFLKYKDMLEKEYSSKVKEIHFKNKTIGWNNFGTKVVFENDNEYFKDRYNDLYMVSYLKYNLFLRPCCFECQFKTLPRYADLTLGDFWGVGENVDKSLDDNKGTSVVLINSEKGKELFTQIEDKLYVRECDLDSVKKGNACLFESAKKGDRRDIVFKNIDKYPFDKLIEKYCEKSLKQRLLLVVYYIVPKIKKIIGLK